MIIGLTGKMGVGKDTIYERASKYIDGPVERRAFADKMKDMACALFEINRQELEDLKRNEDSFIELGVVDREEVHPIYEMNFRQFLQRLGTQGGREILGEDIWVDQVLPKSPMAYDKLTSWGAAERFIFVTDVRFANEAKRIKALRGEVWEVIGPEGKVDSHVSESGVPRHLINYVIDNSVRDDGFASLDAQLERLLRGDERSNLPRLSATPPSLRWRDGVHGMQALCRGNGPRSS